MSAPPVEHPNVASYRRMIEGFNSNELGAVANLVADDVIYTIPGRTVRSLVKRKG